MCPLSAPIQKAHDSEYLCRVITNYSAFAAAGKHTPSTNVAVARSNFIAALLICEYLATFPDEVDLFWRRRCMGASVLFFMNRYAPLLFYILVNTNCWILTNAVCVLPVS